MSTAPRNHAGTCGKQLVSRRDITRVVYVNLVIFSLHKYAGAFAFAKFRHQEYSVFILTTINLLC